MFRKAWKYLISMFVLILLKSIISNFREDRKWLVEILDKLCFHPAIINRPSILFNIKDGFMFNMKNISYMILKLFMFSIKVNCWSSPRRQKWLVKAGIRQQYAKHTNLIIKNFSKPNYCHISIPEKGIPKGKKVVYSVMFGDYDEVIDPIYISTDCDYILFTDSESVSSNIWTVIRVSPNPEYSMKWNSLYYKVMAHRVLPKKYECSIYIDSSILIHGNIIELFRFVDNDSPLVMFKNIGNSSLLEEFESLIRLKWAPPDKIREQYNYYISSGFPDNLGQIESGVLIRYHKQSSVIYAMDTWMKELTLHPYRDQMSIMYSLWKSGVSSYHIIDGSLWDNQFFIHKKREHKIKRKIY
ncbi:MAG: DUF616 domain-containing protein [Paludibacteraceae bacterium]|nr:DUF616 domain-containing protein [Paludibacteraceae bacterium]